MGALGPVFRTYEPTADRLVAVKVFRLDVTPEQAQALADELTVAADAGLFHPSVVEPIAAGVEGTVAYRAEEYVAAETLDVALRHYAPAPIDKVLPLIAQLAGAIDFARTAGVGHGALHPRDIFVTPEEARATGFGVVEALERVGLRAPVRRPYSAPERVGGGGWGTPADVFSLAAIAYELLTGRRPAGAGSQIGTVAGTSAGNNPGALHAVFVQAMDENPARRYQTALGFASALDAAARGEAPLDTYERGAATGAVAGAAASAAPTQPPPPSPRTGQGFLGEGFQRSASEGDALQRDGVDEDVLGEKQEDEAHGALLREEADPDLEIPRGRLRFDETVEEDLTLDAPAALETERFADEFSVAAAELGRPARDLDGGIEDIAIDRSGDVENDYVAPGPARAASTLRGHDEVDDRASFAHVPPASRQPVIHERPRTPVVPIAIAVLVGLLLGGVAVYAFFMRGASDPAAGAESTTARQPPASLPNAAPSAAPSTPYSEGTVGKSAATSSPAPAVDDKPRSESASPPAGKAAATAKSGRVVVSSSPRGASVTVNGRSRGRTPLTLTNVPFGPLEVRVVRPGYATQTERVTLSSSTPSRTLSFNLQRSATSTSKPSGAKPASRAAEREENDKPESFTGSIYVDSRPRGARVLLNGKVVGTTPMRIPDIRIGSHIIRLQLDAHADWTASTRVVSGQESRVTGSLERNR